MGEEGVGIEEVAAMGRGIWARRTGCQVVIESRSVRDEFGKDAGQAGDILFEVVVLENPFTAVFGNFLAEFLVVHQPAERGDQGFQVAGRHQQPVVSVADYLRNAGNVGGQAGDLHGHGLHEHHRQPLGKSGNGKDWRTAA